MLATFLRRLGISRGFPSAAGKMGGVEERLFEALFPGEGRYTPDKASQLASRLRETAASLDPPQPAVAAAAAAPPHRRSGEGLEDPDSKRRRKEQRGRGEEADHGFSPKHCPAAQGGHQLHLSLFGPAHPRHIPPPTHPPHTHPIPALPTRRQGPGLLRLPAALRGPGAAVPGPRIRRLCEAGQHGRDDRGEAARRQGPLGGPAATRAAGTCVR